MRWHDSHYIFLQDQKPDPAFFTPEFLGAFFGAFFAFLFGLVSYKIVKRYERFVQHRNAVVVLERLLNEHADLIGINRTTALNTQKILERKQLTHNRLIELPIRSELNIELGSIIVVNRYFSYERWVHRMNVDMQAMNYTLTRFEDVVIGGSPLPDENWHYITGAFAQVPGLMDKLDKATAELLCVVRINLAKLKGKGIWYANLNRTWDIDVSDEELKQEMKKLAEEVKVISAQPIS